MSGAAPLLTVALPVKDGAERLSESLDQVDALQREYEGQGLEALAVDDGSTDATPSLLAAWAQARPWARVLTHPANRGKGAALKTAVAASTGRVVVTVDADATYPFDMLDGYLRALDGGADAAIANRRDGRSRYILHPRDFAYIARRHFIGGLHGRLARAITGVQVADLQAGFKVYRGEVARSLFPLVDAERFAFDVEILSLLQHYGFEVAEQPVTFVYKQQPSAVRLFRDGLRMVRRFFAVRDKLRRLSGQPRPEGLPRPAAGAASGGIPGGKADRSEPTATPS